MAGLIGELTALQKAAGWLSDDALRELAERLGVPLHRLESLSTFYTHFRRTPPQRVEIQVCRDLSCSLAGGETACAQLRAKLAETGRGDVEVREVSCLGRCDSAPAAVVAEAVLSLADPEAVLAAADGRGGLTTPETGPRSARPGWGEAEVYANPDERYGALRSALAGDPTELSKTLEDSGLRGMGGAGFPTGRKWKMVAAESGQPKYVVCNADESEPGTFKDREILRDLPHLVLEGMALAGYCVGAERGWIFIRHEYGPEREQLESAIADARERGVLGQSIFGSNFNFDVEVFVSPGGYILGEETALLECMEDRRGEPRNKPPFPGSQGLWNQPTLMNNVETFAHATGILQRGLDWWRGLGQPGFSGHKFISVSGDVAEPGVVLVPFGTTLGELLERCGGMREGCDLAAVAPGGASSNFLPVAVGAAAGATVAVGPGAGNNESGPATLEIPLDFDTLAEAGSMLGSGAAVFVGAHHDLLEVGLNVTRFFRNESCGKCVPCRVGSEKAVKLLEASDAVTPELRELLGQLNSTLVRTSICGLGQVALGPLISILDNFPDRAGRR